MFTEHVSMDFLKIFSYMVALFKKRTLQTSTFSWSKIFIFTLTHQNCATFPPSHTVYTQSLVFSPFVHFLFKSCCLHGVMFYMAAVGATLARVLPISTHLHHSWFLLCWKRTHSKVGAKEVPQNVVLGTMIFHTCSVDTWERENILQQF